MNIKFPRDVNIDYVRIIIGENTTSVKDEGTYMLFAGYRKNRHNSIEKIWMKARVPFRFTVVGNNGKRPSAINLHHNNAYGFITMLLTKPKSLHLDFWYDNASTLTTEAGLACQSLIVSSGKNQIELDNIIRKSEYDPEDYRGGFSMGMVNLDKNYPKFDDMDAGTFELEVTDLE